MSAIMTVHGWNGATASASLSSRAHSLAVKQETTQLLKILRATKTHQPKRRISEYEDFKYGNSERTNRPDCRGVC